SSGSGSLSMMRYALACDEGHAFESWFANSATYDRQVKRGLVSCPVCNSTKVEKAIMAPRVAGKKRRGDASVSAPMPEGPASSQLSASKARPEAPQFALQLRALCSDHPIDGPSFDQVALRVALSFGRVFAEDEPAGQLGRRTQHSLVMLDHGI